MRWYDYIGGLGIVLLGIAIFQSFSLGMYMDFYMDFYSVPYMLSSYEIGFFVRLWGSGITLTLIGVGINRLMIKRKN